MKKNQKNKFKTPEGYFDSFNNRLMDKIAKEESCIPKTDGFGMPDDYFEDLHGTITDRLDANAPKVISLGPLRKFYYAAAAIAAIMVLTLVFNGKDTVQPSFEDLASTEIDAYFDTMDVNLSSYEIAEVVSLDAMELNDVLENRLDDDYLLEYLDENIKDIEELDLDTEYYE